jgi:hypothetical protein
VGTFVASAAATYGDLKLAADCYKALLPFVAPKLRSIEVNAVIGHEVCVVEVATGICGAPGSTVEHSRTRPCSPAE